MLYNKYKSLKLAIDEATKKYNEDHPLLIKPELLSVQALNPFIAYMSASRAQMVSGHVESSLRTNYTTKRKTYSGYEIEYGKTAYQVKAPCDMVIHKVLSRYGNNFDNVERDDIPEYSIVYEDMETRAIGILKVPKYIKTSEQFGVRYVINESLNLDKGSFLPKDTVIAISDGVNPTDGTWQYGAEGNVAYMSDPRIIQDGIVISESFCKKLTTKGIASRTFSIGKNKFPLNIYGDGSTYKIIPDIGEYIADHRMIVALRRKDPYMVPLKLAPRMLRLENFDPLGDEAIYINQGDKNARVINVSVHYQAPDGQPLVPIGMADQLDMYRDSSTSYALNLYNFYKLLIKNNPNLELTKELQNELRVCISEFKNLNKDERFQKGVSNLSGMLAKKMSDGNLLDEYLVTVTYEYDIECGVGSKITNVQGGKGIIVNILPDADMPADSDGNRADVIFADISVSRRTIPGAMYETALNAYSRDLYRSPWIQNYIDSDPARAFDQLIEYYNIVSPLYASAVLDYVTTNGKVKTNDVILSKIKEHLKEVRETEISIWLPQDSPKRLEDAFCELIDKQYPITYGPVWFRDVNGNMTDTYDKVLIGSAYIILLDKLSNSYSAVSSSKVQHHGLTTRTDRNDKFLTPTRETATRLNGETENRIEVAITDGMPGGPIADMHDRNNNPATHKNIITNLLSHTNPMAVESIVDRDKVPRGNSRPLLFTNHALRSWGVEFVKEAKEIDSPSP